LVARQRLAAYQKFVFMKYLDNLIAWADTLFRQDSFESINQATQLYVIAGELLGQRPQDIESLAVPRRFTYAEIQVQKLDAFSNALADVEYLITSNKDFLPDEPPQPASAAMASVIRLVSKAAIFQIPRNERLDSFWDTVQDRLFKIRNSLNIEGVKRTLALFEPPINPALLVAAAAAGLDIGSVVAQLNTPLPHYRFSVWMQRAIDLANELKSFGAEFLAALEKKDGEDLQLLRQSHEIRMLDLVRKVKERQVAEAEGNIRALELSRVMADDRRREYGRRQKISGDEQLQVSKTTTAKNYEALEGALHSLAALLSFTPDGDVGMVGPFPLGKSNFKIGSALVNTANAGAAALGALASLARGEASLAGLRSSFDRRWEDWKLQERLAGEEMNQIDQQIAVANIRLAVAEQELDNHDTQIDQAKEVQDFLKTKFTSRELYSFMVTELSKTFQLVYKLAFDSAKTAERTFQFELGVTDSYVKFGYQDSLHQGLLAGEKLIYDLKRMEVGYLERYKREFEIGKPISLAALDGQALQDLRENGTCKFELPEVIFDLDFPGQYFRRVKAVRLTIPCVTGPHTSVSAKLTLLGSAFRKVATVDGAYPYSGTDDTRFVHNPVGIQAIATGSAQNDAGLFELNFRDERYLPFEGAGAMSRWQLDLPTAARQFDYDTISDVVINLSYTAREGGDALKTAAESDIEGKLNMILKAFSDPTSLTPSGLVRAFSLRKEFPDVLHRLLTGPGSVNMTLLPEHFPFLLRDKQMTITVKDPVEVHILLKTGQTLPANATVSVNGHQANLTTPVVEVDTDLEQSALVPPWTSRDVPLAQANLSLETVEDIVLVVTYTV
ncbi:MAG TPA: hypothetical protein VN903_40340, partial [Polyangia bacterium]|nr:hypothetical protein [Polyangia bacterium]